MRLRTNRLTVILVILGFLAAPSSSQQIVYVDIDRPPGGDGLSWETAFNTLQDAIAEAATLPAGVEARLWIAEGTYFPDRGSGVALGDRTASFEVTDEMQLLGGFDGTETDASQRDPVLNPVIFSGDLAQDDVPPFGNNTENSLRIITTCGACNGAAVIDGVTIQGGNADIAGTTSGAGIFVLGASVELSLIRCDIRFNSAGSGGAVVAANANVTIDDCLIENNRGVNDADALWAIGSSRVTLISTVFNANIGPGQAVVNEFGSRVFADDTELLAVENIGQLEAGGEMTAGAAHVAGTYFQENAVVAGVLEFDLGGTTPGEGHDRVDIAAEANLAGVASLNLINGFMPAGTDSFELLQAGFISHEFDLALFPQINNGFGMELTHTGTESVVASLTTLPTILDVAAPLDMPFPGQATDIALGDFSNDSIAEAAMTVPDVSPGLPGDVVILVNDGVDGDGGWNGFGPNVTVPVGAGPVALAVGDLDGDLLNDIVVANYEEDTVSVLLNNNDLLGENPFIRTDYPTGGSGPLDVAIGDADMTNGPDIIVANESGEVTVLANLGGGVFDFAAILDEPGSPGTVDPADLDNDKDIDIIIGDNESGSILVAMNIGDNTFEFTRTFPIGGEPIVAQATDLNGDFQDDVTALVEDLGVLVVLFNEGGGDFSSIINVPLGGLGRSMSADDLDGDGDVDIAVVIEPPSGQRYIQVLRNDSTAAQAAYTVAQQIAVEENPLLLAVGDITNDLVADIVSPGPPGGPLAGGFASLASRRSTPFAPCGVDANADGAVDVSDLLAVLSAWGPCPGQCPPDTNGDGVVDVTDLLAVLAAWGSCP